MVGVGVREVIRLKIDLKFRIPKGGGPSEGTIGELETPRVSTSESRTPEVLS